MPCHVKCLLRQLKATFFLQHPHHRHADRHQGWLSILRQSELILRSLEHELGEMLIQRVIHLFKYQARCRKGLGQSAAHSHSLTALPRKYKSALRLSLNPFAEIGRASWRERW